MFTLNTPHDWPSRSGGEEMMARTNVNSNQRLCEAERQKRLGSPCTAVSTASRTGNSRLVHPLKPKLMFSILFYGLLAIIEALGYRSCRNHVFIYYFKINTAYFFMLTCAIIHIFYLHHLCVDSPSEQVARTFNGGLTVFKTP